jgi:hypothetical protein
VKQASAVFDGYCSAAGPFPTNLRSRSWLQDYAGPFRDVSEGYSQRLWVKIHGSAKDKHTLKTLAYAWLHQFTYRFISTTILIIRNY